jgi:hypothetical protein
MILKPGHSAGLEPARGYCPRGVAACHTRPADKPARPQPGGPVQPRKPATSPRAVHVWDGVVACSLVPRWQLDDG